MSFGFKYGLPVDADLVVDVRFLPNPYWVPELRPHDRARRRRSRDYVLGQAGRRASSSTATSARSSRCCAGYLREGKRYVTVAVGCTGGKHRCVAMTEELAGRLRERRASRAIVVHRDLGRE